MPTSFNDTSHALFVCEGTFEEVAIRVLRDADGLVVPAINIVDITRSRSASQIQDKYLNVEYDWPLAIIRIIDSRKEQFKLGNLYRGRYEVINAYTRPEAEMLTIVREGCFVDYSKHKNKMKPSQYCKQVLGLSRVKSKPFLEEYWDAESLTKAAREYKRLQNLDKGEICLADLLKTSTSPV